MSEQAKHTPGPWRVEEGTTLIWGNCDPSDKSTYGMGYPIAEARIALGHRSPSGRCADYDQADANAHLIAAAPDLLEVVHRSEALLAYLLNAADADGCVELDRAEASDLPDLLAETRAALSKALGQDGESAS